MVNKIGLKFQQNLLKVDTNIVLYQVLFLVKILNIITTDICIAFQLNARIFTLYSIGI